MEWVKAVGLHTLTNLQEFALSKIWEKDPRFLPP
jgi:hypothetical protein